MKNSNYSPLERNIIGSLETDEAQSAFFWAREHIKNDPQGYKAEMFAREVDLLVAVLRPMLQLSASFHLDFSADNMQSLLTFILKRHAMWRNANARTFWGDSPTA